MSSQENKLPVVSGLQLVAFGWLALSLCAAHRLIFHNLWVRDHDDGMFFIWSFLAGLVVLGWGILVTWDIFGYTKILFLVLGFVVSCSSLIGLLVIVAAH